MVAGLAADRVGRTLTAGVCLALSGTCALLAGAAAYPDELAAQLGHSRLDQHVIVNG